jgi:hypothetical protein
LLLAKDGPTNTIVSNFISQLFSGAGIPELQRTGELYPFAKVMFASLMMHFPNMVRDMGYNDIIICNIMHVGNRLDVSLPKLGEWSKAMREQWELDNAQAFSAYGDALARAQCAIDKLIEERNNQKEFNERQEKKIDERKTSVDALTNMLQALIQVSARPMSPRKRAAISHGTCINDDDGISDTGGTPSTTSTTFNTTIASSSSITRTAFNTIPSSSASSATMPAAKNAFQVMAMNASRARSGPNFPDLPNMS